MQEIFTVDRGVSCVRLVEEGGGNGNLDREVVELQNKIHTGMSTSVLCCWNRRMVCLPWSDGAFHCLAVICTLLAWARGSKFRDGLSNVYGEGALIHDRAWDAFSRRGVGDDDVLRQCSMVIVQWRKHEGRGTCGNNNDVTQKNWAV